MSRVESCLFWWLLGGAAIALLVALYVGGGAIAHADTGTASYYTVASCQREGTSGIMANGRKLNDEAFTAASWDYHFGTRLAVCRTYRTDRGNCVQVVVTDRGPAKHLYRNGRILDLSRSAFEALAPLREGIIKVTVEVLP